MICPNCDGILNVIGCNSCGWKHADSFPAHRMAEYSAHPLRSDAEYPPDQSGQALQTVSTDVVAQQADYAPLEIIDLAPMDVAVVAPFVEFPETQELPAAEAPAIAAPMTDTVQ